MKKETNKTNWTPLAIVGSVVALIIGFWKSLKIGKIMFTVLTLIIIFGVGSWGIGKVSDVYFGKIRFRNMVDKQVEDFQGKIKELEQKREKTQDKLLSIDRELKDFYKKTTNSISNDISSELHEKYDPLNDMFYQVEKALNLIKEEERQLLKEKIIKMKEDVIVHEKSIESSEIRLQCEDIAEKVYLLKKEEKIRFYKDLKDIGFELEQEKEELTCIYTNTYSTITRDSISMCTARYNIN